MKVLGLLLTLAVFAFWGTMTYLVVRRQQEIRGQDLYRAGFTRYIGNEFLRERWLSVYRKNKKIGYTGYTFRKDFTANGSVEITATLESRMEIAFLGQVVPVRLEGRMILDGDMKPLLLKVDMTVSGNISFSMDGSPRGDDFLLTMEKDGEKMLELSVPREELFLGDGLVPALPVSGFQVGDEYNVPCFDPLTMSRSRTQVKVTGQEVRDVRGLQSDVFILETRYRGLYSRSWVTATGELLRQEFGPPLQDVVLRRDTRENARRYFRK